MFTMLLLVALFLVVLYEFNIKCCQLATYCRAMMNEIIIYRILMH